MNATANPARILVVDDEEHLADGVCEILQPPGYSAQGAHDGVEGLRKALAQSFDLILLDVMMPKMDGLRTCEELRRNGLHTPVLFLTVKGAPEDRIRGLEAGGDDYLPKPFHLKELLLRV
ncbi:MAG: response regulator, partial [Rhodospirillaceae bacterium]|nr:response regulator [Rhodospirillaceae bacterium]